MGDPRGLDSQAENHWFRNYLQLMGSPHLFMLMSKTKEIGACLKVPNSLYGSKQARYRLSRIRLPSREFSACIPPTKHLCIKETKSLVLETESACPWGSDQEKQLQSESWVVPHMGFRFFQLLWRACHLLQISVCWCSRLWKETGKFPCKEPQVQTLNIGQSY